jgi:hypothetical protein
VIGALYEEPVWFTYWENGCSDEHYYSYCDQQSDPEMCRSNCIISYPYVGGHIYHDLPSDGIVTSDSQTNRGGNWRGYVVEASGVNHREFRTVNNIDPIMRWILNGGNDPSSFSISY